MCYILQQLYQLLELFWAIRYFNNQIAEIKLVRLNHYTFIASSFLTFVELTAEHRIRLHYYSFKQILFSIGSSNSVFYKVLSCRFNRVVGWGTAPMFI